MMKTIILEDLNSINTPLLPKEPNPNPSNSTNGDVNLEVKQNGEESESLQNDQENDSPDVDVQDFDLGVVPDDPEHYLQKSDIVEEEF